MGDYKFRNLLGEHKSQGKNADDFIFDNKVGTSSSFPPKLSDYTQSDMSAHSDITTYKELQTPISDSTVSSKAS